MLSRKDRRVGLSRSVEACETRALMSGTSVLSAINLGMTTKPSVGSAYVEVERDAATSTALPQRLHFIANGVTNGVAWGFSTGDAYHGVSGDVWITDVTNGRKNVFNDTLDVFRSQSSTQGQSWLIAGHTYQLYFRRTSHLESRPFVGSWSAPYEFHYGTNATLAKPNDAASMAETGLRLIPHTPTIAPDQPGDWGLETYSLRRYTQKYEIEIRNIRSGELYQRLTLDRIQQSSSPYVGVNNDLSPLLPVGPTPPGAYSIRMRALEGYRETNDAAAVETWTDWSAPQVFHIYVQPVVITSGSGSTLDKTPTLRWKSVPEAIDYEVWIGQPGAREPMYVQSGINGLSHTVTTPLPNGDYVAFIRARLNGGGISQWGAGLRMSIGGPVMVNKPEVARTVSWNRVPTASRYEIWVDYLGGEAPAGSRYAYEARWRQTTFSLPKSAPAGTYRIWIRAILDEGKSTHRSTWSRAVDLTVVRDDHNKTMDAIDFVLSDVPFPV